MKILKIKQNKRSKKTVNWLGAIFVAVIIGVSLQIARAWIEPTIAPPNGNTAAPVNIGGVTQYKTGALEIGGVFETNNNAHLAVTSGEVGIGTTTPSEKLTLTGGNFLINKPLLKQVGAIVNGSSLNDATSVYVSGKYAYVTSPGPLLPSSDGNLSIIDVSDPSNPTETGLISTTTLSGASSVHVSGKYAYVASESIYNKSLSIIDVSNPSNPTEMGVIKDAALFGASSVYVSGKHAYVVSKADDSLSIVDISDPNNPTLKVVVTDAVLNNAYSVYVSGKYAYVASAGSSSLSVFDISDPSNPTKVGFISAATPSGAVSVYVSGKYAYVVSMTKDSLSVIDVSDPSNPTETGVITNGTTLNGAASVYVSGKYAYVASAGSDGISIIDISDPSNPTEAGFISTAALNGAGSVYVSGKYAYVASAGSDGISIIDISGIDAPAASIGSISASTIEATENVDIENNLYARSGINVGPGGIKSDGPIQGNDLEILKTIRMIATTTAEVCDANTNVGNMYYDDALNEPCYCDGSAWTQFDGGGAC